MERDFVHHPLNQEVTAIGGSYVLQREERMAYGGREVLYVVGFGVFDACCGVGGCSFALVPGFILRWREGFRDGLTVSAVEPIAGEDEREALRRSIMSREDVAQVNFL